MFKWHVEGLKYKIENKMVFVRISQMLTKIKLIYANKDCKSIWSHWSLESKVQVISG